MDREERPDIDAVYMAVCQMMTGSGGWPLTIVMTPDRQPFFAATYLPRRTRFGRQGLIELCERVRELWALEPQRVAASAAGVAESLGRAFADAPAEAPGLRLLDRAYDDIAFSFDARHGGFGPPPSSRPRTACSSCCASTTAPATPRALEMVERTLAAMRLGGIYDHVGLRLPPLLDRRPLARAPLREDALRPGADRARLRWTPARSRASRPSRRTAREIFAYVLRDMTAPEGGFFSAEDADSEGEEGKFYVWTRAELRAALGADEAAFWEPVFNVTAEGNYREEAGGRPTGANILHLTRPLSAWARELGVAESDLDARWEAARARLFAAREARVHPLKDDKVLTDWNGLMIAALAEGARVLGNARVRGRRRSAPRASCSREMRGPDGRLFHRFREGERAVRGQATDYAFMIHGLLHLYRAPSRSSGPRRPRRCSGSWSRSSGTRRPAGSSSSARTSRELPVRPKDLADGAAPVGQLRRADEPALAVPADRRYRVGRAGPGDGARLRGHGRAPPGGRHVHFLCGLDFALRPGQDVVLAGEAGSPDARRLIEALNGGFAPNRVTLFKSGENAARLARLAGYTDGLDVVQGRTAAHLCVGASCKESVTNVDDLIARIAGKPHDRR